MLQFGVGAIFLALNAALIYISLGVSALDIPDSAGDVVQYAGAINLLVTALNSLLSLVTTFKMNRPHLEMVYQFLDLPEEQHDITTDTECSSKSLSIIEFENVSFQYPGQKQLTLKNVSLRFEQGKRYTIVGFNGAGKSTIIKLLCRLYQPTSGVIKLDGIDIAKIPYSDYIKNIGVLFQDYRLFSTSIQENIILTRQYDKDIFETAITDTGAVELLNKFPPDSILFKDYEEKGVHPSGGELQKIALARTLYTDAEVLVLDEPTAALDPISEFEVFRQFNAVSQKKTVIYTSHRMATCQFSDKVYVIHNGEVVQCGTHQELLYNEDGLYYELWNAQAQYYNINTTT